ncbi:IS200/IS605 family transposase [Phaeocystidibacter luteus]|uniref:IS200/IS605 family transposase n=1 Tax=Phaeocystidibacter luteus TaxID=911197 RepID=A0A6N6RIJ0_9FLAO|nr:IS200/IS605 family transposase [Phaeocystidibacter luteus]KAB2810183.1 IS200/IS605 family transposase [Phaeocystidibacter luteus]
MGNSFTSVYIHAVWSTKYRNHQITPSIKLEVESLLISVAKELGVGTVSIFAMPNHVHMLLRIKSPVLISEVIGKAKGRTSKRINEKYGHILQWQQGYGAFSISASHVARVKNYIENQVKHHETHNFEEEYLKWLVDYQVEYEDRYVFGD